MIRGGGITNKFRVAVAESKGTVLAAAQTYSSCADDISNRVITAIGPTLEAHQTSIAVGGAYYFGRPSSMEDPDGVVLCHSPVVGGLRVSAVWTRGSAKHVAHRGEHARSGGRW